MAQQPEELKADTSEVLGLLDELKRKLEDKFPAVRAWPILEDVKAATLKMRTFEADLSNP
jgi:hypothetical protein